MYLRFRIFKNIIRDIAFEINKIKINFILIKIENLGLALKIIKKL